MKEREPGSYREYLKREFEVRTRRNPSYSLRAYARDIGMSPSKVSECLRGLRGISPLLARKLARKLDLSSQESKAFVAMVESEHSRSAVAREKASERIKTLQATNGYSELDLERFRIISDWWHFSILEMCDLIDAEADPKWFAKRLEISVQAAKDAIERLIDFGLLEAVDGKLRQTQVHLATPSGVPSRALREHHSQIISKANEAIEKYTVDERDLSSMTMSFDSSELEQAKEFLKEFRRRFAKDFQRSENKDRVYCLSIQFFPMENGKE